MSYFYRGRHRRPTRTARNTAAVALALAPLAAASPAHADEFEQPVGLVAAVVVPAGPLDAIAECESGGSYTAQNPNSSASGKYQFLDSTWKAMGGSTAHAKDASPAEQDRIAAELYAEQGTAPWLASKSCWGGKTASAPKAQAVKPAPKPAAKPAPHKYDSSTGRVTPAPGTVGGAHRVVEPGDTLSQIAVDAGQGDWHPLYEKNRAVVGDNPNLIFPGQDLAL